MRKAMEISVKSKDGSQAGQGTLIGHEGGRCPRVRNDSIQCRLVALAGAFLATAACSGAPADDQPRVFAATAADAGVDDRTYTIWRPSDREAPGELRFEPLAETLPDGFIQLDNGVEVDGADWPATLVAKLDGGGYCTASIVGPRTLLTAAHCVDLGKEPGSPAPLAGGGTVELAGRSYALSCEMAPSYAAAPFNEPRTSSDYALCILSHPVPTADLRPESISTTALTVNSQILMAGYGCKDIAIRTVNGKEELTYTPGDGNLRMGQERISYVGDRASGEANGVWVTTQSEGREPTLCPGDSGGPAFQGVTLNDQRLPRRVTAVNSAVGWSKRPNGSYRFYSFLSPLGSSEFKAFLSGFVSRHSDPARNEPLIVCGFNRSPGLGGCRA